MRVTQKVREQTRERILRSARTLFLSKGFENSTTRDIATEAGIAAGTLFNYYPSKEALGMALLANALDAAEHEFSQRGRRDESIEELLFAHALAAMHALGPFRPFVAGVLESAMNPFAPDSDGDAGRFRARHLETVARLLKAESTTRPVAGDPDLVTMHLYWTLFLGAIAFWTTDQSRNQEDTLVVLDQSIQLFVQSLKNSSSETVAAGRPPFTSGGT